MIGSAQHLGQPLYQEYAHVRSRAHAVPPPVYVTAAPSQAATAIQQQQVPTYQGFTPGWVTRELADACIRLSIFTSLFYSMYIPDSEIDLRLRVYPLINITFRGIVLISRNAKSQESDAHFSLPEEHHSSSIF